LLPVAGRLLPVRDRTVRAYAEHACGLITMANFQRARCTLEQTPATGNWQPATRRARSRYNQIERRDNFAHGEEHLRYILFVLEFQVDAVVLYPYFAVGVL
jgi:hypothetical protein